MSIQDIQNSIHNSLMKSLESNIKASKLTPGDILTRTDRSLIENLTSPRYWYSSAYHQAIIDAVTEAQVEIEGGSSANKVDGAKNKTNQTHPSRDTYPNHVNLSRELKEWDNKSSADANQGSGESREQLVGTEYFWRLQRKSKKKRKDRSLEQIEENNSPKNCRTAFVLPGAKVQPVSAYNSTNITGELASRLFKTEPVREVTVAVDEAHTAALPPIGSKREDLFGGGNRPTYDSATKNLSSDQSKAELPRKSEKSVSCSLPVIGVSAKVSIGGPEQEERIKDVQKYRKLILPEIPKKTTDKLQYVESWIQKMETVKEKTPRKVLDHAKKHKLVGEQIGDDFKQRVYAHALKLKSNLSLNYRLTRKNAKSFTTGSVEKLPDINQNASHMNEVRVRLGDIQSKIGSLYRSDTSLNRIVPRHTSKDVEPRDLLTIEARSLEPLGVRFRDDEPNETPVEMAQKTEDRQNVSTGSRQDCIKEKEELEETEENVQENMSLSAGSKDEDAADSSPRSSRMSILNLVIANPLPKKKEYKHHRKYSPKDDKGEREKEEYKMSLSKQSDQGNEFENVRRGTDLARPQIKIPEKNIGKIPLKSYLTVELFSEKSNPKKQRERRIGLDFELDPLEGLPPLLNKPVKPTRKIRFKNDEERSNYNEMCANLKIRGGYGPFKPFKITSSVSQNDDTANKAKFTHSEKYLMKDNDSRKSRITSDTVTQNNVENNEERTQSFLPISPKTNSEYNESQLEIPTSNYEEEKVLSQIQDPPPGNTIDIAGPIAEKKLVVNNNQEDEIAVNTEYLQEKAEKLGANGKEINNNITATKEKLEEVEMYSKKVENQSELGSITLNKKSESPTQKSEKRVRFV